MTAAKPKNNGHKKVSFSLVSPSEGEELAWRQELDRVVSYIESLMAVVKVKVRGGNRQRTVDVTFNEIGAGVTEGTMVDVVRRLLSNHGLLAE